MSLFHENAVAQSGRPNMREILARFTPPNEFQRLRDLGYHRLIPITPPGAALSERSTLFHRPGSCGKAPGIKGEDGLWRGLNWLRHETTEADLVLWKAMGAGIGIRTGEQADGTWLIAVDADTMSAEYAGQIEAIVKDAFGVVPTRIGRAPKTLFLLRTSGPLPYACIEFDDGIPVVSKAGKRSVARVELLGGGKQFVAWGVHPHTRTPYHWTVPLPPLSSLLIVSPAAILGSGGDQPSMMAQLEAVLPSARPVRVQGAAIDRSQIDQEKLKGDPELIRKAMEALPNTIEHYPHRDDMLKVGFALRAATIDHPHQGRDLYHDWCAKWEGGDYRDDETEAVWLSMKGPYALGASWLYGQAEKNSNGRFTRATCFFEPPQNDENRAASAAEEWPEPFDLFGNANPLDLAEPPAEAVPDLIEAWARSEARRKGTCVAFASAAALAVCAAAIGTSLKIRVHKHDAGWLEPAGFWIVLVGSSGIGKSPIINAAMSPLVALDGERYRRFKPEFDRWSQQQKRRGGKGGEEPLMPRPVQERSVVDDVTIEKQIEIHSENPRGILRATDEYIGLLESFGAYKKSGGGDRQTILRTFDGRAIHADRLSRPGSRAEEALMSLLAGTQPDRIGALVRDLGEDGMLQRTLFILDEGTRRTGIDEVEDRAALDAYRALVRHLATVQYGMGTVLRLNDDAHALLATATERIAVLAHLPGVAKAFEGHVSKWGALLPRLILTFHCIDRFDYPGFIDPFEPISLNVVEQAVAFAWFLLRHSLRFYELFSAPSVHISEARRFAGHLLTRPDKQRITHRDISDVQKDLRGDPRRIRAMMRELEIAGWCMVVKGGPEGATDWLVNPLVHVRFEQHAEREKRERKRKQDQIREAGRVKSEHLGGRR